jgi:NADPH-dependent glutamate synthase beta subunit-like oxidoreductase/Pyruvate/2-oxoacid:ferredoxin oxidoreductase delta subunit
VFPGRNVATLDATSIAVAHKLGTRAVPIVNSTILGMACRVLGLEESDALAALEHMSFGGANLEAAREGYERVVMRRLPGERATIELPRAGEAATVFDDAVGSFPQIRTGSWASNLPCRRTMLPPCSHACPAGNDIQGFIERVTKKDYDGALEILSRTTPFPSVCGRVCPAPCMEACNRHTFDDSVNIRDLERYVGDHAARPTPTAPTRDERVAVVGSGPAGLSTAYHLARLGHRVTLFEADTELGGVMRTGIPSYRLPRETLDAEIDHIVAHGVEVRSGHRVDRAELLRLTHDFDAVFVGTGLQELRSLNLGNLDDRYVMQGIDFLDRARHGGVDVRGEHVVVVGGGNTAFDAARTARRLGAASVHIVYRRTRAEMPAIAEEIEEGLAEGIQVEELVLPLHLQPEAEGAMLTCTRMRLGEPDASGRARPIPEVSEDAQFGIKCDRVLLALGQSSDLSILPEGAEIRDGGELLGLAGAPVFAGGDFATNEGTVTAAIGSGHNAALHIHQTLTGEDRFPDRPEEIAGAGVLHTHLFKHAPAEAVAVEPPSTRRSSFVEVRGGLVDVAGHEAAIAEAERCFSCGVCNECDRCMTYCPEGVLLRDPEGDKYSFDYDFCKGCGVCASQCPRGVIFMGEV